MGGCSETGRGALRHPLFWGALVLLVLNDHVLKGAGVLPGALTGKLSDFAGMVVAPVLVATAFRARQTPTRLLAFAAATLPFVAINVSPSAAAAMESLVGLVGLEWRIWSDPSDLIGLAALPAAWWVLDAEPLALPSGRAVEGVGLVAAAFACMATSGPEVVYETIEIPPLPWDTAAHLHNGGDVDVEVRLRWVEAEFACERVRESPGSYLGRAAFGEGVTVTLDPSRNFPLTRAAAGEALEAGPGWLPRRESCDAVLVQRAGSSEVVVFFEATRLSPVYRHSTDTTTSWGPSSDRPPVEVSSRRRIAGGDGTNVIVSPLRTTLGDDGACPAADAPAFVYSGEVVPAGAMAKVAGTEMLRDGCFEVSFEVETGENIRSFLCVPMWAFDLVEGDEVRFDRADRSGISLTRLADGARGETQVEVLNLAADDPSYVLGYGFSLVPAASCPGAATACGAYAADMQVSFDGELLYAGDEMAGRLSGGRGYRLAIGAARETVVGVEACLPAEQQPGFLINAVVFSAEEE